MQLKRHTGWWQRGRMPWLMLLAIVSSVPWSGARAAVASAPAFSTFSLFVNPGLGTGKTFACPAIQHATATITVSNRFVANVQNDDMRLTANGLPPKTGFDVFLVEHSPISNTSFGGFGQGWYQSDLESDANGQATVDVQGIFDQETFIEDPSAPFSPVHTFDVGFWFNSPAEEQQVCGNATAPKPTPFNGEQNAGLLAMITQGEPLQLISNAPPGVGVNVPARGTSSVGRSQVFVTTCTDRYGWTHIRTIDLRLVDGRRRGTIVPLALWVQYDQNANMIRLYDPRSRRWQQGTPGSRRVLSNGFVTLYLAGTRVQGRPRTTTVRVTWQIAFTDRAVATGYRQQLRIVDDFGATRGWHVIGSWSVAGRNGAVSAPANSRIAGTGLSKVHGAIMLLPHVVLDRRDDNTPIATATPSVAATATSSSIATATPSATATTPAATATATTPASTATATTPASTATATPVPPTATSTATATSTPLPTATETPAAPCNATTCFFTLAVNPGLLAGKPFACPAIQHANAKLVIRNRFATGEQNDLLTLIASGLPPNSGFDLFLVENSPLDGGAFGGFGNGWYQSDVESDGSGQATINVHGIFDKETFIEKPANGLVPTHTYNVGFWFNSPTEEQQVCGNAATPATTPFNGEQNAGLLAMITKGEPLQLVQ